MKKYKLIKKGLASLIGLMTVTAAYGQNANTAQVSDNNMLEIVLLSVMGLLVFVIWLLSRVLLILGKQLIEKSKKIAILPAFLAMILLFYVQPSSAQDTTQVKAAAAISNYGGLSPAAFYIIVSVLALELIIILFLTLHIRQIAAQLLPEKKIAKAKTKKALSRWARLEKKLTRSVPVEREADVMLDHDYDGIRELDNPLPPWWKYGFYITIGVAVVYLFYFEVFGYGKNPTQEYNAEMARAKIQKEIYESKNKDKIDENHIHMADAEGLAEAKQIFTTTCFACHGKQGQGGVGPNLTDDYWLHKGSLNDIYQSIKHGYPDKGMQAWSAVYSPVQIRDLASYVKTLHGTNPPNAKAPQGDLYIDSSPNNSNTSVKSDSLSKK